MLGRIPSGAHPHNPMDFCQGFRENQPVGHGAGAEMERAFTPNDAKPESVKARKLRTATDRGAAEAQPNPGPSQF
jgi:hypothetical protein